MQFLQICLNVRHSDGSGLQLTDRINYNSGPVLLTQMPLLLLTMAYKSLEVGGPSETSSSPLT